MAASLPNPSSARHRVNSDSDDSGDPIFGESQNFGYELTPSRLRKFLANTEKPAGEDGCWIWRGGRNGTGHASSGGNLLAYRVAYEWMVGPVPNGLELDHLCRNRACVNPHHLEPVTRSENVERIRRYGPFELRRYCRQGHALVGSNKRWWSDGSVRGRRIRCYACHDGMPYGQ